MSTKSFLKLPIKSQWIYKLPNSKDLKPKNKNCPYISSQKLIYNTNI